MKALHLTQSDSMLVITSAGDNALHYAIAARPNRIHCVDMNPYQGHLLELKLAAIQSLDYEDFFSMFGRGRHPDFISLLDAKIAPYLSSSAYQFWRANVDAFSSSFYMHGYSGLALRLAKFIFKIARVANDVKKMCDCDTLEEQATIWHEKLRPVLLNPVVVALLKNPVFCWNALGVPLNQRQMILKEGTFYDYVMNTLDPLASTHLFKTGSYFYLLTLLGHYTDASCPLYLTPKGFEALKNDDSALNAFRLHTNSLVNVLQGLSRWSLTRALVMDHLDWFSPGSADVDEEIQELYRVIAPGGLVFWRSAGKHPWYNKVFEEAGFKVSPVAIRGSSFAIDRVNMYASFWRAERV
jgi:betaine lipid synthase